MQWLSSPATHDAQPYSAIAALYDHLMRHVNYIRWATYVIDLFRLSKDDSNGNGAPARMPRTVLELACGTGKLMLELAKAGYRVIGMDRSPAMLRVASRRLQSENVAPTLWCGNMQWPAMQMPVDAVLCLYDSLNYCQSLTEVAQVLQGAAQILRPGGLFIFDVCTLRNCKRNFRNYTENDGCGRYSYTRYTHFDSDLQLQYNEFVIVDERRPHQQLLEQHVQKIYALREIRSLIAAGPWHEAGCFDGMSRRPGTERADRVHFVLQKLS